jgi:tRNA(Arg) A34 adenosine deaminase TadA
MCFGAIHWSGVRRVIIGAAGSEARKIGFDEGPRVKGWKKALEQRGIDIVCGVGKKAAAKVLSDYAEKGGKIYNSRE